MLIIKYILIILIGVMCAYIGKLYSKTFYGRVDELKEIKSTLIILETKIKYTYGILPEIFKEISENTKGNVSKLYLKAYENMEFTTAKNSWKEAVKNTKMKINNEDKEIIKQLSKQLGNTDMEGQIKNIQMVNEFLDNQIEEAEIEKNKNGKMYKKLGITIGLILMIILI